MLTGDVSETGGFRLFRSRDFGLTFDPVDLPFEPLIQMLYNPGDCNIILTLSVMVPAFSSAPGLIYFRIDLIYLVIASNPDTVQTGYISMLNSNFTFFTGSFLSLQLDLWLSEDFGATWRKIHDSVCLVRW